MISISMITKAPIQSWRNEHQQKGKHHGPHMKRQGRTLIERKEGKQIQIHTI